MKYLTLFILLIAALWASPQSAAKHYSYRPIRTITTDLNNDDRLDTIVLISSLKRKNDFDKISISLSGYCKTVFKARDFWTEVDSNFLVSNKNTVHSKLLFIKKTSKQAVILLFGEIDGAGYRGEFSIINIENNHIKMAFDPFNDGNEEPDIESPVTLTDLERNDRLCFIYKSMGEIERQVEGGDIGTYTPFFVYPVDDFCRLSVPLTKKYNEDHYVFAGIKPSEKIRIFYPNNGGKPRVWKK